MTDDAPRPAFLAQLEASVREERFVRLTLGKPRGADPTVRNVFVRPVVLRDQPQLSFLWRHERQDVTRNFSPADGLAELARLIGTEFHSAHLFTAARTVQLEYNKKGEPRLTHGPAATPAAGAGHDRTKTRLLPAGSQAWLERLGVTTPAGQPRAGMADKHRQIHKFVEVLSHLVAEATFPRDHALTIADMGCGKGYLTFATHDFFNLVLQQNAEVLGVETRAELVALCNQVATATGRTTLHFQEGTIAAAALPKLDVLIALHACDTATDDAIMRGIAGGATLIVTSPCCQQELRPQLRGAVGAGADAVRLGPLGPALRHGIFQERQAEFATDALRALLLEWAGYTTKVFEFISTEHTAKNLMIAATKRSGPARTPEAARAARELAAFYGITQQALARQLEFAL